MLCCLYCAEPFVNHSLIFETSLDVPMMELPELNQIGGLECPTDNVNGTALHYVVACNICLR